VSNQQPHAGSRLTFIVLKDHTLVFKMFWQMA